MAMEGCLSPSDGSVGTTGQKLGTINLVASCQLEKNYICSTGFSYANSIKQKFQARVKPSSWKQTPTENIMLLFFAFLLNQAEGTAFYTQGLFNKQVCLTSSAQPVPGFGLSGCYWLQPAALRDRTSGLLCPQLKASLMAELARGPGLQSSGQLQDRKLHTTQSQHSSIKTLTSEVHVRSQKTLQLICWH